MQTFEIKYVDPKRCPVCGATLDDETKWCPSGEHDVGRCVDCDEPLTYDYTTEHYRHIGGVPASCWIGRYEYETNPKEEV